MREKRPASWESSVSRLCDNIDFTIERAEHLALRVALFVLALIGLWTIVSHHR